MKKINKYFLGLLSITMILQGCKDEDLITLPVWESAVHGYTVVSSASAPDFKNGDPSVEIDFDLLWKSIDGEATVTQIDLYILFNEAYVDLDGNPKTASHGGSEGELLMSLTGADVPAGNVVTSFTVSQDDVYNLYSTATFDYGTGSVAVFANPDKPDRDTTNKKFIPGDSFSVKWIFTTEDGRVFDSWSPSVCTEFPEANCQVNWSVVCAEEISNPNGDYTLTLADSYGDGWNGAAITVLIDGVGTDYTLADGATGVEVVSVPPGTTTLTFEFVSGDWDSEASFTIKSPSGNVIANIAAPPTVGPVKLDLCLE
tara:strand:+ start:5519 stop:6460 length:942 start_codon:yes stop_codon:yes gene_type:complete